MQSENALIPIFAYLDGISILKSSSIRDYVFMTNLVVELAKLVSQNQRRRRT